MCTASGLHSAHCHQTDDQPAHTKNERTAHPETVRKLANCATLFCQDGECEKHLFSAAAVCRVCEGSRCIETAGRDWMIEADGGGRGGGAGGGGGERENKIPQSFWSFPATIKPGEQ